MVLSARGMRSNSTRPRRQRSAESGRDKPQRAKAEKRVPLKQKISDAEAEIERITGIISKIETRSRCRICSSAIRKQAAQLSKARAGAAKRAAARRGGMAGGKFAL